jgi:hypothetical protein
MLKNTETFTAKTILQGKEYTPQFPAKLEAVTIETAARIFAYLKANPEPVLDKPKKQNNRKGLDNKPFFQIKVRAKWLFGLMQAVAVGEIPPCYNFGEWDLSEKQMSGLDTIINHCLNIVTQIIQYKPAPINKFAHKGISYTVSENVGEIGAGRGFRGAIYAESLDSFLSGEYKQLACLCACIALTDRELEADKKETREPIHQSAIDARALGFADLPYIYAQDIAFFLSKKCERLQKYTDMLLVQRQILRLRQKQLVKKTQ